MQTHPTLDLSADPITARSELARFDASYLALKGIKFDWNREHSQTLLTIFGNSRILTDRLIANPSWAEELLSSKYMAERKPLRIIKHEIESAFPENKTEPGEIKKILRNYKYREMIRLVSQDLAQKIGTEEMLAEWSDVADCLINAAYDTALNLLFKRFFIEESSKPCSGSIIALGKLGSQELNLSSDVDLITIYSTDEKTNNKISNHEFFCKLTMEITQILAAQTEDGFVFRVDHELRPEGAAGTLANSLDAILRYYEYFGHNWERASLIRARPVAGNTALGETFISGITPFVYRRSISIKDLSHMREMKIKMEKKALERDSSSNIKVGPGGIRELEFFIQAFQTLNGGGNPALRKNNTFEAIKALKETRLIHSVAAKKIEDAWKFLRRLENMIQIEDTQTHTLPREKKEILKLAKRCGYTDTNEDRLIDRFSMDINLTRMTVEKMFNSLFDEDYERHELEEAIIDNLSRAQGEEEEADALAWFKAHELKRILRLDLENKLPLEDILKRTTKVAEVTLCSALKLVTEKLTANHGKPQHEDGTDAKFAIIGMGKLGSEEMDYGSDLDLCFLYSGAGKTLGPRSITNVEFFTKLAQRIISLISLTTRYGRAYLVDSELRPSGRSGALVATLESFKEYHTSSAQVWEKLALLKARVISGDISAENILKDLAYTSPPPGQLIKAEIDRLRNKTLAEIVPQEDKFNIKNDKGGLSEIDAIIQFHQILHAAQIESLQKQNTFDILSALSSNQIIDTETRDILYTALSLYRTIMAHMRALTESSLDVFDKNAAYVEAIADKLEFATKYELLGKIETCRREIREIYEATIK